MAGVGYFQLASNMTQYVMTEILNDEKWVNNYIKTNRERIHEKFQEIKRALEVSGIQVYESEGTLMCWADLRKFLPKNPTWEDEKKLCKRLFDDIGWLIQPGHMCRAEEPGFFRIVYTESGPGSIQELCERLKTFEI